MKKLLPIIAAVLLLIAFFTAETCFSIFLLAVAGGLGCAVALGVRYGTL